jgi:Phage protein Gp138 N-terminal domain
MTTPTIKQNVVATNVSEADLLRAFRKDLLLNLNCHHIGKIQSFDKTKQTASATINYKKTFFSPNPVSGVLEAVLVDYPVLIDAPVIFLGGGTSSLTFPLVPGDDCVILFNDRDIDTWYQGANNAAVATPRLHSFADGLILVGIRAQGNVIADFDGSRVVLRNGASARFAASPTEAALEYGADIRIAVGVSGLITFQNATLSLKGVLTDLTTQLQNLTTLIAAITVSGVKAGPDISAIPVNAPAIGGVATEIGALLA